MDEEENPVDTRMLGWNAEVDAPAVPAKAADEECVTYE